jgi:hypothetical protein
MDIKIRDKTFTINEQYAKSVSFQKIVRQMRNSNDSSLILDLFDNLFGVEQAERIYKLFGDNFEAVIDFFQSEQFKKTATATTTTSPSSQP